MSTATKGNQSASKSEVMQQLRGIRDSLSVIAATCSTDRKLPITAQVTKLSAALALLEAQPSKRIADEWDDTEPNNQGPFAVRAWPRLLDTSGEVLFRRKAAESLRVTLDSLDKELAHLQKVAYPDGVVPRSSEGKPTPALDVAAIVEECAQVCIRRADAMRKRADIQEPRNPEAAADKRSHADWVEGCADSIRHHWQMKDRPSVQLIQSSPAVSEEVERAPKMLQNNEWYTNADLELLRLTVLQQICDDELSYHGSRALTELCKRATLRSALSSSAQAKGSEDTIMHGAPSVPEPRQDLPR